MIQKKKTPLDDQEVLAEVWGIEKFHSYFHRKKVYLRTDNKAIETPLKNTGASSKIVQD